MSNCSRTSALIVAVVTASLLGASLIAMHGSGVSRMASAAPATQDLFKGTNHYTVPTRYRPGISAYSDETTPRSFPCCSCPISVRPLTPGGDEAARLARPDDAVVRARTAHDRSRGPNCLLDEQVTERPYAAGTAGERLRRLTDTSRPTRRCLRLSGRSNHTGRLLPPIDT